MTIEISFSISPFIYPKILTILKTSFHESHPRTLSHHHEVRRVMNDNKGKVENTMCIDLPWKVEPEFFDDVGENCR